MKMMINTNHKRINAMMTTNELRRAYLDFFASKNHAILPSASLIPEHDPSALFINSGMHPLVPYLSGQPHPKGTRLASCQRCIRTTDIDDVGDATHNTFFEMLGNWSLGDYGKRESISWSWEFLTSPEWLHIPQEKLAVTAFQGNAHVERDTETADTWKSLGMPEDRTFFLSEADNWWSVGATGLCGPDTEIFFDRGAGPVSTNERPGRGTRFVEIWNNVFMEFTKRDDGRIERLPSKNVDTGMGLERTVAILNGMPSNYDIDVFSRKNGPSEIVNRAARQPSDASVRIILDHARAATFLMADGVTPSNIDQGYILRRLIRRAIRHARKIGIAENVNILNALAESYIAFYSDTYPHLIERKLNVLEGLSKESAKFEQTLEKGMREFEKRATITGVDAFELFSTYGFPLELTQELVRERGKSVNEKEFREQFEKHQERSRQTAANKFKGGLQDHSELSTRYHTTTHLLHRALRDVLGDHVEQRGSNITPQRLRFDFSHPNKLTPDEIQKVERIVNEKIKEKLEVTMAIMPTKEAKKEGAIGIFNEKYGEMVNVYSIGNYSKEICGGPHIKNTAELGHFTIIKEQSSSSGIRRIKATLTNE